MKTFSIYQIYLICRVIIFITGYRKSCYSIITGSKTPTPYSDKNNKIEKEIDALVALIGEVSLYRFAEHIISFNWKFGNEIY